jgi:hypothetical protein
MDEPCLPEHHGPYFPAAPVPRVQVMRCGRFSPTRVMSNKRPAQSIGVDANCVFVCFIGLTAIRRLVRALNGRPRKALNWKTPAEALDEFLQSSSRAVLRGPLELAELHTL